MFNFDKTAPLDRDTIGIATGCGIGSGDNVIAFVIAFEPDARAKSRILKIGRGFGGINRSYLFRLAPRKSERAGNCAARGNLPEKGQLPGDVTLRPRGANNPQCSGNSTTGFTEAFKT